ncbi:MAG: hypothetical protein IH849_14260 [Acidobacteria bacterium]|nr:hypothetical protein [Acidobacteriota bacterium]
MKARSIIAILVVVVVGAMIAGEALAQKEISVQNRSFAYTGKSGQNANYRWSATIDNPSRRDLNVRVTLEMLNAAGEVVASDRADVMLPPMDSTSVEQTSSVALATAETATQYRVVLMEIK